MNTWKATINLLFINIHQLLSPCIEALFLPGLRGYVTDTTGRALEWHSRGQRFDPAYLHHHRECEENLTSLEVGFLLYAVIAEMSSPAPNCSKSMLKSMYNL